MKLSFFLRMPTASNRRDVGLLSLRRALQGLDVELDHLEHPLHDTLPHLRILVPHQLGEDRRHDLPGQPELVLEPAALHLLAAFRELAPVVIDLFLVLAVDDERNGLRELELRTSVQRNELLAVELEVDDHDRALGSRPGLAVPADALDLRVLEDGGVELRRLLGVVVEPQEWSDSLHVFALSFSSTSAASAATARRSRP